MSQLGVILIGRNEGERLRRSLESLKDATAILVYVDSGSTDNSVELATAFGAEVVLLDTSVPFTAARARNAGFERLMELAPNVEFVQFLDGDCQVAAGWFRRAIDALRSRPEVGVVAGRRREINPAASIYNQLCDIEWDTPVGEAKYCGGDSLVRVQAFQQAGRFDGSLIAGEEPELCVRIRQHGWKIVRLNAEMTLHDAAIYSVWQWWRRATRAGHAFAEGAAMHGAPPERHWVRESRSTWIWGLIVPLLTLLLIPVTQGWSLLLLGGYLVLTIRMLKYCRSRQLSWRDSVLYSLFTVAAKFPELQGQIRYQVSRFLGSERTLIEYRRAETNSRGHVECN